MKQSFISIAILIIILVVLIIILVATVYYVSKAMRYKTEREKSARTNIAYLLTDSWLISWLVYRKNDPNDHL